MTQLATSTSQYGLTVGDPIVRSVGAIAFGPSNILFVADNREAKIFAIDVPDAATAEAGSIELDHLDTRLAAYLGCGRNDVSIRDMAIHPSSRAAYLSIMRGGGEAALPVLMRIGADGTINDLSLRNVAYSEIAIKDAPAIDDPRKDGRLAGPNEGEEMKFPNGRTIRVARNPLRTVTVTDMHYLNGMLIVAGASNEEFSSTLRRIPFPFADDQRSSSLEIFHVSHGKYETASPIRNFIPYRGGAGILASYTCTPVVHFSMADLASGDQVKGRTVAELGAGNTPLDMVAFNRSGEDYVLVSNTTHGLFKIALRDIETQQGLTEPSRELVGVPRTSLPHEGVSRMAAIGDFVLMMQADGAGEVHLRPYNCATL